MKSLTIKAFFIMITTILASCATSSKKSNIININDSYETQIEKIEKGISVSLKSNPTTGYSWSYKIQEDGIVEMARQKYIADVHKEGLAGSGGKENYIFKGVKAGETKVTFTYARPWKGGETDGSVSLLLKVDSQGNTSASYIE